MYWRLLFLLAIVGSSSMSLSSLRVRIAFAKDTLAGVTLGTEYHKSEWNQDLKSNFETSEFWDVPIPKFALVRIIVHQLKNLNLKKCMVSTQEFEFCFQIFIPLVLRNFVFETSKALLSMIL